MRHRMSRKTAAQARQNAAALVGQAGVRATAETRITPLETRYFPRKTASTRVSRSDPSGARSLCQSVPSRVKPHRSAARQRRSFRSSNRISTRWVPRRSKATAVNARTTLVTKPRPTKDVRHQWPISNRGRDRPSGQPHLEPILTPATCPFTCARLHTRATMVSRTAASLSGENSATGKAAYSRTRDRTAEQKVCGSAVRPAVVPAGVDEQLLHQFRNGQLAGAPVRSRQTATVGQPVADHPVVLVLAGFGAVRARADIGAANREEA